MSDSTSSQTIYAQELVGRKVYDAHGKFLGRVYDFVAEREGDDLCITGLLVGARTWISRFGWTRQDHGLKVPWEQVADLSPNITLRRGAGKGG